MDYFCFKLDDLSTDMVTVQSPVYMTSDPPPTLADSRSVQWISASLPPETDRSQSFITNRWALKSLPPEMDTLQTLAEGVSGRRSAHPTP